jgi:hypothetical protein
MVKVAAMVASAAGEEAVAAGEIEAAASTAGASSAVGLQQDLRLRPHLPQQGKKWCMEYLG